MANAANATVVGAASAANAAEAPSFGTAYAAKTSAANAADAAGASRTPSASTAGDVVRVMREKDSLTPVFRAALEACEGGRRASEVEELVRSVPQFRHCYHEPFEFLESLVGAGGIDAVPLEDDGAPMAAVEPDGPGPADYLLTTTEAGLSAAAELAPARTLTQKLEEDPARKGTFLAVLGFCRTPRTLDDVRRLFSEHDEFARGTTVDRQKLSPDFYLSELERAGGLVWQDGWRTTQAGVQELQGQGAL